MRETEILVEQQPPQGVFVCDNGRVRAERLVFYCRTTSASTTPRTPRRTCCPYAYALIAVLRVSRVCELFPDGLDLLQIRVNLLAPHDVVQLGGGEDRIHPGESVINTVLRL